MRARQMANKNVGELTSEEIYLQTQADYEQLMAIQARILICSNEIRARKQRHNNVEKELDENGKDKS